MKGVKRSQQTANSQSQTSPTSRGPILLYPSFICSGLSSALTRISAPQLPSAACFFPVSIHEFSSSRCAKSQKASSVFASSHFQEARERAVNDTPAGSSASDNSTTLGSPSLSVLNRPQYTQCALLSVFHKDVTMATEGEVLLHKSTIYFE